MANGRARLLSGAGMALAAAMPAMAQVDVITVTAERRAESIQEVPVAVSAFDGELLQNLQINNVTDIELISPSVTFTQSTNALNSSVNIRGVGTAVFSSAVEPSVSFVVDGVVLARQGQAFTDLIDVERVEVLRGPQSTLFGKNASAGVVSIVTMDPTDEVSASADVTAAQLGEYAVRGTVSGPIAPNLAYRVTGYYREVGGYIDNVFDGNELNGSESWGLRGKLKWTPGSAEFTLIGDYSDITSECCAYIQVEAESPFLSAVNDPVLDEGPDNRSVNVSAPFRNDSTSAGVSLEAKFPVGSLTATSISAWRKWNFGNNIDVDSTPDTTGTPSQLLAPVPVWPQVGSLNVNSGLTDINQYTQEIRIESPVGQTFEYIVGLYGFYLDLDREFRREVCFVDLAPCPAVVAPAPGVVIPGRLSSGSASTLQNTNLAAFGQGTWNVNDRVSLFAGARLIYEDIDYTSKRPPTPLNPGDLPLQPFFDEAGGFDDFGFAGRAGATWQASDSVNTYISYNRGYKGPTLDLGFLTVPDRVDAETSDAFEIGVKSLLAGDMLQLNVAVFYALYDNYQAQGFDAGDPDVIGDGRFILTNVGEVSTVGAEIEYAFQPNDRFSIQGGVTYADATIESYPNAPCFNPISADVDCLNPTDRVKDVSGGELANAPKWRANTVARYQHPIPGTAAFAFLQGTVRYQSETQFSLSQNPKTVQEGFGTVDASFGFGDQENRWLLTFFVQNLFDQTYANALLQHPTETATVNIFQYVPKRAERYAGATLRFNF